MLLGVLPSSSIRAVAAAIDTSVEIDTTYYNPELVEVKDETQEDSKNTSDPANHFAKKPSTSVSSLFKIMAGTSAADQEAIASYNYYTRLSERTDYQALDLYKQSVYTQGSFAWTEINTLANQITVGCTTEVDKVQAIYNWVCTNIFYDYDLYEGRTSYECSAGTTLSLGRGVCEGYAELTNALIREVGIPAKVVGGYADSDLTASKLMYAQGQGNHGWVEAYFDPSNNGQGAKWVTMDTTWGSSNSYKNGLWNGSAQRPSTVPAPIQQYFNVASDFYKSAYILIEPEHNYRAATQYVPPVTTDASGCQVYLDAFVPTTSSVGAFLFYNVEKLTSINLTGVKSIGNNAFQNCTGLTSVDLAGVVSIGAYAFQNAGITTLHIPVSLRYLRTNAFYGCKVQSITVDPANPYFKMKDGMLYDITGTVLYLVPSAVSQQVVTISGNTRVIADGYLSGNQSITKIIIEEGVTSIGDNVFTNTPNLEEVVLPNSLGYIGQYFLQSSSVKRIKIGSGLSSYSACAFQSLVKLESITVDSNNKKYLSMSGIMYRKMANGELSVALNPISNSNVTVEIPANLSANLPTFFGSGLVDARFGGGITENIVMNGTSPYYIVENGILYSKLNDVKNDILYIPMGSKASNILAVGGADALNFKGRTGIRSVILPEGVSQIEREAFKGCTSLEKVEISSTVTKIDYQAFWDTGIKYIYIPSTVTSIPSAIFQNGTIIGEEGSAAQIFTQKYVGATNFDIKFLNGIPLITKDLPVRVSIKRGNTILLDLDLATRTTALPSFILYRSTNAQMTDQRAVQTNTSGDFEISENNNGVFYYQVAATADGKTIHSMVCKGTVTETGVTKYTITSTTGANGTISPNASTEVVEGNAATFTLTPDPGYTLDTLEIDGVSVYTADSNYVFEKVLDNHTIDVTYRVQPIFVTITYVVNGGVMTDPTVTIPFGSRLDNPKVPTRTGYTFGGWYSDQACTTSVNFDLLQKNDASFYAKWEIRKIGIVFNKNTNGGYMDISSIPSQLFGTIITSSVANPTREGFDFMGWSKTSTGKTAVSYPYQITAGFTETFYAIWKSTGATCTLTLMPNGGEGGGEYSSGISGSTMAAPTASQPNYVYRKNYQVSGWYTDEACTAANKFTFTSTTQFTTTQVLYPKWESKDVSNDCTVTVDTNGGDEPGVYSYRYVTPGSNLTLGSSLKNVSRKNYTLSGWSATPGGSLLGLSFAVTSDRTIYAKWTVVKKKIEYYYTSTTTPFSTKNQSLDTPITLPVIEGLPAAPTGKVFAGWYTDPVAGIQIEDGNEYITTDTKYYAHFDSLIYDVTYDLNFSTDTNQEALVNTVVYMYGDSLSLETPTITAGKFAGWYTKKVGGDHIRTAPKVYSDATYYAHWVAEDTPLCNITFDMNGAAVDNIDYAEFYGAKIDAPVNPVREGYYFKGWYTMAIGGSPIYFTTTDGKFQNISKECFVTSDAIYYAHWSTTSSVGRNVIFKKSAIAGENESFLVTRAPGEVISVPECPYKREGYIFLGWYDQGTAGKLLVPGIDPGYTYYWAYWRRILPGEFKVTFTMGADGYVMDNGVKRSQLVIEADTNDVVSVPVPMANTPTKKFVKWEKDSGGAWTKAYSSIKVGASDVTVTASFIELYTVAFQSNGGSQVPAQDVWEGSLVTRPVSPVKPGYTFNGWYKDAAFKTWVDFSKPLIADSTKTYYASWKLIATNVIVTPKPIVITKPTAAPTAKPTIKPTITPSKAIKMGKGILLSVKSKKSKTLKVTLKKVTGAKGYEILLSTNKKFTVGKKKVVTSKLTSTVKSLKKGSVYYVKVRAYSLNTKKKKVYGSYSAVKKVKIKK